MKKYITLTFALVIICSFVNAQNKLGKADDAGRIALNIYIPEQAENIPDVAESLLRDRISEMMTAHSLSGSNAGGRFIVVPVVSVLSKEVTSNAPAMTIISIQATLYIGDGYEGTKFAATSLTSKGVGANETKAYMDAIKKLKANDPKIAPFIENGKKRIIEYYNSMCDFNIKKANTIAGQNNFDEAMFMLIDVPEVSKDCYDKSMDAVYAIFKKSIDYKCGQIFAKAKAIWSASQDVAAANAVAAELINIDPNASCVPEVNKFIATINKRVLELDKREWDFKLKQQQDDVDLQKAQIRAIRDIGVAYGNNQPKTVYNTTLISTWW